MVRILIADDHPLFRDAMRQVVESGFKESDIIEAGNLDEARAVMTEDQELDLVLLDIHMPGAEGYSGLVELRKLSPATPIVIVSGSADATAVEKVIEYGAAGFIPKAISRERMQAAIRTVMAGEVYHPEETDLEVAMASESGGGDPELLERMKSLTAAETKVFHLLVEGKPNKIIAYDLDIKESTVKAHISAILRKLQVFSRTQAVLMAKDVGFKAYSERM
ncbi:MAG: response regulator transcription factor [Rhodospirillaceae bacterium]|nr:response regulator transcription factor [Rhodospirillaceae bacterium]MBL6930308.1 response regulator transcription factor [Rhodospirillales bacterium]